MVHFDEFLKTWSFWPNSVTRQASFNMTKIGENAFKNSNATFWVLFKHCIRYAIINFDLQCNCWLLSSRDDKSIARWSKAIFSRQKIGQSPRRRKCEFMRSLTATCQVMRQTKRPCSSDYQKCNEDKH